MNINLLPIIEGTLFLSGENGVSIAELLLITNCDQMSIEEALNQMKNNYQNDHNSGLELLYTSGTYKLVTKKDFYSYFEKYAMLDQKEKLGVGSLEILSIIAYNQPITRFEIENLKGTSITHGLRLLQNKDLIYISGKKQEIGSPNLYSTTSAFLDYIGINDLNELPPLKEFALNSDKKQLFVHKELSYKDLTSDLLNSENTIILKEFDSEEFEDLDNIDIIDIETQK